MSASLTLLDRALILAQHELDALRAGDVETAEQHFDERSALMDQALETMDEQDPDDYLEVLRRAVPQAVEAAGE